MTLRNETGGWRGQIEPSFRAGKEPRGALAQAYETSLSTLQANPTYQRLVSPIANFDKVVGPE